MLIEVVFLNEDGERVDQAVAAYRVESDRMSSGFIIHGVNDLRDEYRYTHTDFYSGDSEDIRRRGMMALAVADEIWRRENAT